MSINMDEPQLQLILQDLHKRISSLETRRINQQQILPGAIFARHINNAFLLYRGLDKNLPSDGTTEIQCYWAYDTKKLYAWNISTSVWSYVLFT